jgi:hypothetical protein
MPATPWRLAHCVARSALARLTSLDRLCDGSSGAAEPGEGSQTTPPRCGRHADRGRRQAHQLRFGRHRLERWDGRPECAGLRHCCLGARWSCLLCRGLAVGIAVGTAVCSPYVRRRPHDTSRDRANRVPRRYPLMKHPWRFRGHPEAALIDRDRARAVTATVRSRRVIPGAVETWPMPPAPVVTRISKEPEPVPRCRTTVGPD